MTNPTTEQICSRLTRLNSSAASFDGVVYRSTTPKYATESDLLTGEGSRRLGGRWNPAGIAAVYASLSPETAMAETLAHHRYYGIPAEDAMPRTFVAIEVRIQAALDLRNGKVRQRLRISGKHLLTIDWRSEANTGGEPLTQRIGRAIHVEGWEGLVVPSAADPQGHNLVLFPDNLMPDSKLDIRNVERLEAR